MIFIYTIGLVFLIIVSRFILRRASNYLRSSFYEERQGRYHRAFSPFDTASTLLPLGILCVIAIFYHASDKWSEIPGVGAGLFFGLAIGYMGAFMKE